MGSWNHTCAISNLHIHSGQDVVVFLLIKKHNDSSTSFCYGNGLYDVAPVPFYGKYDDYGGVEDCHGFGLPIVLEELKEKLYKFGQGPNSCHDCEVNKDNLTIETLFEFDSENRLGIDDPRGWHGDDYDESQLRNKRDEKGLNESEQYELDRLAAKIRKEDSFRQVTHVVIHGYIFKSIMEKWYLEEYVGDGKGNRGWNNNYVHTYFKDLTDSIPEFVNRKKIAREYEKQIRAELAVATDNEEKARLWSRLYVRLCEDARDDPCMAVRWINHFKSNSESVWGLINVTEHIDEYSTAEDWLGLAKFTHEVLTAEWVDSFMSSTRKIWVKQSGVGGQNADPLGYRLLAKATLDILDEERREYGGEEDNQ